MEITENIDYGALSWEKRSLKVTKHFKKTDVQFSEKLKNLKDLTAYAVRIKAKNGSGFGDYCVPQTFITPKITVDSKILKDKEKAWFMTKILPKNLQKKNSNYYFVALVMVFKHMYFTKNATRKEKQLLLSNQHWVMYLEVTQPFHGPLLIIMLMTPNHLSSCYVLQKVVLLQDGRLPTLPMPFIHIQLMAQLLVEDLIFIYAIIVILQIAATPI